MILLTQKVGNANNIVSENVELKFVVQVFGEERLTIVVIGQTK